MHRFYSTTPIIQKTMEFKIAWLHFNKLHQGLFHKEDIALIQGIASGIITTNEQNHHTKNEYIGRNLFSLVEFIRVDINGKHGIRTTHPQLANEIHSLFLSYLNAMTSNNQIKIRDKFNNEIPIQQLQIAASKPPLPPTQSLNKL